MGGGVGFGNEWILGNDENECGGRDSKTARTSNLKHKLCINSHSDLQREPHWHTEPVSLAQACFNIRSPHKDWVKLDLVDILVLDQRTNG